MISPTSSVMGFVVAGGKSSRMGRDKAFLDLGGRSLLAHALELVGTAAEDVRIVGEREKFSGHGVVLEDVFVDRGPLGGIHAALRASNAELNLMLAVDLPLVRPEFLEYLLTQAGMSNSTVTVPQCGGHFQSLCAVYRRSFADVAEKALLEGKNKIDLLFATVPVRILEEEELSQRGFGSEMFHNVNTPEDLKDAREWFAREGRSSDFLRAKDERGRPL